MTTFDDRENAFEAKFAHDSEMQFRAEARRTGREVSQLRRELDRLRDSDGDGKGDLKGLIQRLDYLQDLGIKGLWLLPVTQSSDRDHGYAVKNYRAIETDYGTQADFELLISEAHKRGIGVIVDYVINHSSNQHPLFMNSSSSAMNAQRNYFVWQNPKPTGWQIYGQDPWHASPWANGFYFAGFSNTMPDFNLRATEVEQFHHDNLRYWLNKGVDGFRFDAVGNLVENSSTAWEVQPENHTIMSKVRQTVMQYNQRYMVCEAPANSGAFADSNSCGSAFAFDLSGSIVGAAKGDVSAIQKLADYYKTRSSNLAPFVSNHDRFAGDRLWNQLQGNVAQYKLAAASYLLLPGTPYIYYGEEIGMAGAKGLTDDPFIRGPYSWLPNEATAGFTTGQPYRAVSGNVSTHHAQIQKAGAESLWSFYRDMVALRNTRTSLAKGSYEAAQAQGQVLTYQRKAGQEHSVVVINYGAQAAPVSLAGIANNVTLRALYPSKGVVNQKGAQLTVPAQSVHVFAVEK